MQQLKIKERLPTKPLFFGIREDIAPAEALAYLKRRMKLNKQDLQFQKESLDELRRRLTRKKK